MDGTNVCEACGGGGGDTSITIHASPACCPIGVVHVCDPFILCMAEAA